MTEIEWVLGKTDDKRFGELDDGAGGWWWGLSCLPFDWAFPLRVSCVPVDWGRMWKLKFQFLCLRLQGEYYKEELAKTSYVCRCGQHWC